MDFTSPTLPQMAAVIPGKAPVSSASFHSHGVHLFVASEADHSLRLIDTQKPEESAQKPAFKFQREGIHLVEATHHDHSILFAGKGSKDQPLTQRHAVGYHSLYDNKILRKFRGHADEVTDISMCPADDRFLTSSADQTVRLWTLQQAACLAKLETPAAVQGMPHAVYDGTGLVFGITVAMAGGAGQYLHLYDARNYSAGAFAELKVTQSSIEQAIREQGTLAADKVAQLSKTEWKTIEFNGEGNQILVTGDRGLALLLDGFEGTVQKSLCSDGAMSACYTPDDKSVLMGNQDGSISCWNVGTGTIVKKLEGHTGSVGTVAVNPKYQMFASCCSNTALWQW